MLAQKYIDLLFLCKRQVGNGSSTNCLEDIWCGVLPLKAQFPSVFVLNLDNFCLFFNMLRLYDWFSVFEGLLEEVRSFSSIML